MGIAHLFLLLTLLYPSSRRDDKVFRLHPFTPSPYYLVVLVDARHLDYGSGRAFLSSLAKHPSDWSKNADVGHAWIYLCGEGKAIEGGHTGEREGMTYTEGVLKGLITQNPIAYLNTPRKDGAFEKGSGGHDPTFAAKFTLTKEQFFEAKRALEHYDFTNYQLTKRQCTTFATEMAKVCGIELEQWVDITFPPYLILGGEKYLLWNDEKYAEVKLATPDRLEIALKEKVISGEAEYALDWYPTKSFVAWGERALEDISRAPMRLVRWWRTMGY